MDLIKLAIFNGEDRRLVMGNLDETDDWYLAVQVLKPYFYIPIGVAEWEIKTHITIPGGFKEVERYYRRRNGGIGWQEANKDYLKELIKNSTNFQMFLPYIVGFRDIFGCQIPRDTLVFIKEGHSYNEVPYKVLRFCAEEYMLEQDNKLAETPETISISPEELEEAVFSTRQSELHEIYKRRESEYKFPV